MGMPSTLKYILQVSFWNLFSYISFYQTVFQLSYITQICPVIMRVDLESEKNSVSSVY